MLLHRSEVALKFADGGTLFLDEVGELTPATQAKLLRVLQERQFERLGGTRTIHVDVRVIAATNRNLEEAIKAGTFRQDLYYRLNVISLTCLPLRERREDIPLLAYYFVAKYSKKCKRLVSGISPDDTQLSASLRLAGQCARIGKCDRARRRSRQLRGDCAGRSSGIAPGDQPCAAELTELSRSGE